MTSQPEAGEGEHTFYDPMLRWFEYSHLPADLGKVVVPFRVLALQIVNTLCVGAERRVCLRKLLESKDAAVRQALDDKRNKVDLTDKKPLA